MINIFNDIKFLMILNRTLELLWFISDYVCKTVKHRK